MNAATLSLIIQGITAAIAAAPKAVEVIKSSKDLISALFTAGKITKEKQDALHEWVDASAKLAAAGIVPEGWAVEADPE